MGKGQTTSFIIIGLILVIIVSFFIINLTSRPVQDSSEELRLSVKDSKFKEYVKQCMDLAVTKANVELGLNEENKYLYEAFVVRSVDSCVGESLDDYESQGYAVDKGELKVNALFEEEVIIVSLKYPLTLTKDNEKYTFDGLEFTFKKTTVERIEDKETTVLSADGRARIIVSPDTIAEKDGNKVTSLSVKVLDKHFDNLENNIVVGNLVYEGLPDGTTFSKPVELSIDFRARDYPLYVSENSLSIAWWDDTLKIWVGLDTKIENGVATAETNHFTKFAIVLGCGGDSNQVAVPTPYLFKQKYELILPERGPTESETDYENRVDALTKSFCKSYSEEESLWILDLDGSIPKKEVYLKTLNQEEGGIRETVQEVDETFIYGINPLGLGGCGDKDFVYLWGRCCCNRLTHTCDTEPVSYQDCLYLHDSEIDAGSNVVPLIYNTIPNLPESGSCPAQLNDEDWAIAEDKTNRLEKGISPEEVGITGGTLFQDTILGFNNLDYDLDYDLDCVGGKTIDKDGDGKILEIIFDHNGNACLSNWDPIDIETYYNDEEDEGGMCTITPDAITSRVMNTGFDRDFFLLWGKPFDLAFTQATVKGPKIGYNNFFCANCKAVVIIKGTGVQAKGYTICQQENESLYVGGKCMTCKFDPETGLILASEEGGDCSCTRQNVGTAYCDTHEFCTLKDGNPYLETNWQAQNDECNKCIDPLTKESDPDCAIAVYPGEVRA